MVATAFDCRLQADGATTVVASALAAQPTAADADAAVHAAPAAARAAVDIAAVAVAADAFAFVVVVAAVVVFPAAVRIFGDYCCCGQRDFLTRASSLPSPILTSPVFYIAA